MGRQALCLKEERQAVVHGGHQETRKGSLPFLVSGIGALEVLTQQVQAVRSYQLREERPRQLKLRGRDLHRNPLLDSLEKSLQLLAQLLLL